MLVWVFFLILTKILEIIFAPCLSCYSITHFVMSYLNPKQIIYSRHLHCSFFSPLRRLKMIYVWETESICDGNSLPQIFMDFRAWYIYQKRISNVFLYIFYVFRCGRYIFIPYFYLCCRRWFSSAKHSIVVSDEYERWAWEKIVREWEKIEGKGEMTGYERGE